MNLSSSGEYGLLAMFFLAQNYNAGPIQAKEIAANQDIPERYLEQVLAKLKGAGLIDSIRGVQGGYLLVKAPEEIFVGEIIRALSLGCDCGCDSGKDGFLQKEDNQDANIIRELWHEGLAAFFGVLDKISLRNLIERKMKAQNIFMYYI
jgi:Rrf2 family cysteine metabolism transcriptional repressor